MMEGGLSLLDLAKSVPDAPRELVQSVLEVLQVMGVVSLVKLKPGVVAGPDGTLTETATAAAGDASSAAAAAAAAPSVYLYFISSLTRTPEALDLRLLQQSTAIKKANAARARERSAALQDLTSREGLSRPERLAELRAVLGQLNHQEPALKDDALYRTLGDLAASAGAGTTGGGRR